MTVVSVEVPTGIIAQRIKRLSSGNLRESADSDKNKALGSGSCEKKLIPKRSTAFTDLRAAWLTKAQNACSSTSSGNGNGRNGNVGGLLAVVVDKHPGVAYVRPEPTTRRTSLSVVVSAAAILDHDHQDPDPVAKHLTPVSERTQSGQPCVLLADQLLEPVLPEQEQPQEHAKQPVLQEHDQCQGGLQDGQKQEQKSSSTSASTYVAIPILSLPDVPYSDNTLTCFDSKQHRDSGVFDVEGSSPSNSTNTFTPADIPPSPPSPINSAAVLAVLDHYDGDSDNDADTYLPPLLSPRLSANLDLSLTLDTSNEIPYTHPFAITSAATAAASMFLSAQRNLERLEGAGALLDVDVNVVCLDQNRGVGGGVFSEEDDFYHFLCKSFEQN
ncbi:hypothetical protein HK100_000043 [Physocladia obscura]|uniref:Uncharacterized protein n=1 Tax=Physocladia obscura TaxID=109957 RepID=A0AAD5T8C1_9FUNG|nr:hypothetical protein HK100_000043 [Physocladia obscura]